MLLRYPAQRHALRDRLHHHLFFLMLQLPPRCPLFPYTTLFRSDQLQERRLAGAVRADQAEAVAAADDQVEILDRSEEHTSELQSLRHLVCRLLLEKKKRLPERRLAAANGREAEQPSAHHCRVRC